MMDRKTEGRIVEGRGGFYTVSTEKGETYTLRARGKFRLDSIKPLVGDRILFYPPKGEDEGWIEEILKRKSLFIRPPVANVELMLLTIAPLPMVDLLLLDRMLIRTGQEGIESAIIYNKADIDDELGEKISKQYAATPFSFLKVSAYEKMGLDEMKKVMKGKLSCMAGQSGVGKSTLLNAILDLNLETDMVSERTQRGRHTTRHTTLIEKDGLMVLDTPGFSLLDLNKDIEPIEIKQYYPDFAQYEKDCYFQPCYHEKEPGCKVLEAVELGKIDKFRMDRYHTLLNEAKESWRGRYD